MNFSSLDLALIPKRLSTTGLQHNAWSCSLSESLSRWFLRALNPQLQNDLNGAWLWITILTLRQRQKTCSTGLLLVMGHESITSNLNQNVLLCNESTLVHLYSRSSQLCHQLTKPLVHFQKLGETVSATSYCTVVQIFNGLTSQKIIDPCYWGEDLWS
jgi:hypothetical protein